MRENKADRLTIRSGINGPEGKLNIKIKTKIEKKNFKFFWIIDSLDKCMKIQLNCYTLTIVLIN